MTDSIFRVLVTGSGGFIGKNLVLRLAELSDITVSTFDRDDDESTLPDLVARSDAVIHLAGENRPDDERAFAKVNTGMTIALCHAIRQEERSTQRKVKLILASSVQAERDNPYGRSKLGAETAVQALSSDIGNRVVIFRLPGVFGKWCRPNYNSVVATFCHNIARNLPIQISDTETYVRLVYIDDVVDALIAAARSSQPGVIKDRVQPEYQITLGELAERIRGFHTGRNDLMVDCVGTSLTRALYATYISYLPNEFFSYGVPKYEDPRGVFVEMLKTPHSGQFSYFTAHPRVTRGGHYHHTKTEKFLVIKGKALFRFRHLVSNELLEIHTSGDTPQIVDTIPGWSHDITNIGDDEMIVMLWANEVFDREQPDTFTSKV